ncbi:hypothetical protein ACOMHN_001441 [Nucella lapillus]
MTLRLFPSLFFPTVTSEVRNPAKLNSPGGGGLPPFLPRSSPPPSSSSSASSSSPPPPPFFTNSRSCTSSETDSVTPSSTVSTQRAWQKLTTLRVVKRLEASCRIPASSDPMNMPRKLLARTRPRRRVRCSRSLVSDT